MSHLERKSVFAPPLNSCNKNRRPKTENENTSFSSNMQQKLSGGRRPFSIEESKRRLSDSFYHPAQYGIGKMYYNSSSVTKRNGYRKRRSELRFSITQRVGQVLLHYVNLSKMAIGIVHDKSGKFQNFGVEFVQRKVNDGSLQVISKERCRRALRSFEDAGYIRIQENKTMQVDGTWKSDPALIMLNEQFFRDIGLTDEEINQRKNRDQLIDNKKELHAKKTHYDAFQRSTKKTAKKEFKNIREVMQSVKSGTASEEDKEMLAKEYPGYDRRGAQEHPSYKDYTGISKNRDEVIKRNQDNPVASQFLSEIMKKLRPPS